MEDKISMLLEIYDLEEALEVLDVTPEDCIRILLEGGHCRLPPFLETYEYGTDEEQEESQSAEA